MSQLFPGGTCTIQVLRNYHILPGSVVENSTPDPQTCGMLECWNVTSATVCAHQYTFRRVPSQADTGETLHPKRWTTVSRYSINLLIATSTFRAGVTVWRCATSLAYLGGSRCSPQVGARVPLVVHCELGHFKQAFDRRCDVTIPNAHVSMAWALKRRRLERTLPGVGCAASTPLMKARVILVTQHRYPVDVRDN